MWLTETWSFDHLRLRSENIVLGGYLYQNFLKIKNDGKAHPDILCEQKTKVHGVDTGLFPVIGDLIKCLAGSICINGLEWFMCSHQFSHLNAGV